jgi:hypothetical protein
VCTRVRVGEEAWYGALRVGDVVPGGDLRYMTDSADACVCARAQGESDKEQITLMKESVPKAPTPVGGGGAKAPAAADSPLSPGRYGASVCVRV